MSNNKQQTAVEWYTKNDLIVAIGLTRHGNPNWSIDEIVNDITPIQLPSDEEIKKMMELDGMEFDEFDPYDVSYLGGAKWMCNKIQGDNDKQEKNNMNKKFSEWYGQLKTKSKQ